MNKYKIFTILLFLSVTNLFSQGKLTILVHSIDSTQALTNAIQKLDSKDFFCEHTTYLTKEINSDKDNVIKFPNYTPSNILLFSDNIMEENNTNFYKMSCIFKKKEYFYINGTERVPFEYRPRYLRVKFNKRVQKIDIDSLFKKLKLVQVNDVTSSYFLLKKNNGGKFKDNNCKELKTLRESEIIRCAGSLCGTGFFSNEIIIEIHKGNEEKI